MNPWEAQVDGSVWISFVLLVAVLAISPGPSACLAMVTGIQCGQRGRLALIAGDLSANSLQMLVAGSGLELIFQIIKGAETLLSFVAGFVFLWVGISAWRQPISQVDPPLGNTYRLGFLTSITNPKAILFFAALFPQFLDSTKPRLLQLAILGLTYLLLDGLALFAYANLSGRWFKEGIRAIRLKKAAAGLLLVFAVLLFIRAFT